MKDVESNQDGEQPYECFECGTIVVEDEHPGMCPDCSGQLRNRGTPIE